jgi:hypothetical protein
MRATASRSWPYAAGDTESGLTSLAVFAGEPARLMSLQRVCPDLSAVAG